MGETPPQRATRPSRDPRGPGEGGSPPLRPGTTQTLLTERDALGRVTSTVRRTVLPAGLRVVTEEMAGARSASVGVWVGVGSRDETAAEHGSSHFLEHLLFKGTAERSALDISVQLDAVGGELNAFTAKEYTCFHARVLAEDLDLAVDVLGDMVTGSLLEAREVEAERDVILDEIAMHEDDPDDVVHELLSEVAFGADTPLGRSIAGTEASIEAQTRDGIADFLARHYRPGQMVVSAAGALDHDHVVAEVERAFARGGFLDTPASPAAPRSGDVVVPVRPGEARLRRPFEQANVVLAVEGMTRHDPDRYALGVLNTALGGGTSSRLFQEVRERRGLAYSVFSFSSHHADAGLVGVSVGCLPTRLDEVLATVRGELAKVAADGLDAAELALGQGQLRGGLVLGLEDPASRMHRLGKSELVHHELLGVDDVLERVASVTLEDVQRVAAQVLVRPEVLAVVGPR
ncbi:M16 family metallopeptidase [Nocardioides sp. AX2bis]|uniref:M16 family metallopeptidase n=1 Tax=Nocardioides sp. AX2bis TaxID=2653157 RepID=UPI0012F1277D|nr:pitrilysin family protein [Nocardioides sp. AX2bis]VXB74670.1 Zinc protease [Nocardioides sp. AX2bis]